MDIKKQINDLLLNYKDLEYIENKNIIVGKIYLTKYDYYEISIDLSHYPLSFPIVEEIGERIPKKGDRHIYTDTGKCCFTTAAKAQILLKTKVKSLVSFVRLIVIPYLENNSYYELNNKYFTDEYSHNTLGKIEGYKDILGIDNNVKILTVLHDRIKSNETKYQKQCYCGGTKTLRNCNKGKHYRNYNKFKLIDKNLLYSDLKEILNYLKK